MNSSRLLLLLALPLLLSACGTSARQKADYARVEASGVSPVIYHKIVHGYPLSIAEIEMLSNAGISSEFIVRYLHDHDIVFYLNDGDVTAMEKSGLNASIEDYILLNSRGTYWSPGPYPFFGAGKYNFGPGWYEGYASGFYFGGYGSGLHP